MREILFRGKRKDNGEWVQGYVFDNGFADRKRVFVGGLVITDYRGTADDKWEVGTAFYEVIPQTVGQYTGLTDKNGKKIFEGDKCRITRHCILCYGSITFKKGSFWFEEFNADSVIELNRLKPNNYEIEVIGNIHDNPELLAKKC
jgi:uncharacterized phage protein (TIGR01671 family)